MKRFLLPLAIFFLASPAWATTEIFTIPGSNTWTKPSTIGTMTFRVWGSGGNGALLATVGGGGGGGGAYAEAAGFDPTGLNNDYSYTVAAGGTDGSTVGWFNVDFGDLCYAENGHNAAMGTHGAGGDTANGSGTAQYAGGDGSDDGGAAAGGGGGGAGSGAAGSNGSTSAGGAGGSPDGGAGGNPGVLGAGQAGTQPGGGGGGALLTSAGAGAAGMVSVTYTPGSSHSGDFFQLLMRADPKTLPQHWAKHEYAIAT